MWFSLTPSLRPTLWTQPTLIPSSPGRRLKIRLLMAPCCRRRCRTSLPVSVTTGLLLAWVMQVAVLRTRASWAASRTADKRTASGVRTCRGFAERKTTEPRKNKIKGGRRSLKPEAAEAAYAVAAQLASEQAKPGRADGQTDASGDTKAIPKTQPVWMEMAWSPQTQTQTQKHGHGSTSTWREGGETGCIGSR